MNKDQYSKSIELFVTFFNIGKAKFAPGTWGSLAAYPFLFILGIVIILTSIFITSLQNPYIILGILLTILTVLFFVGSKFSQIYVEHNGKEDPKEIVIDEVVGQGLVILAAIAINLPYFKTYSYFECGINIWMLPFFLFRLFDIIKPWPISWIDANVKGGIGVMLDDLIAGIISIIIYYNIFFLMH
ncbi:MAG: phosphatidylglycerophosphatase A [Alphaproteobacteria bacterium]